MFKAGSCVDGCLMCERVAAAATGELGTLIWSREHSISVIGDHQFFPGYAMIISRHHIREMHEMPKDISSAIFQDVLELGQAVHNAFKPWKINYASLGNVVEHLHWHIMPRYENDPDKLDHPWKNASQFAQFATTQDATARIRVALQASQHSK